MTLEATGGSREQPASDRIWSIETNGINVVSDAERHGTPFELFWVRCAANISILAVVYGVIIVSFGLDLWQSILAGVVGTVLSFLLVGFLVAGLVYGLWAVPAARRGQTHRAAVQAPTS